MRKNNQRIPDSIKSKILEDYTNGNGTTVRQLSEQYGISRTTIYDWIRRLSRSPSTPTTKEDSHLPCDERLSTSEPISPGVPSTSHPAFMELSISPEAPLQNNLFLKEIFINFDSFSLSINSSAGESFSRDKLVKILDIMGV